MEPQDPQKQDFGEGSPSGPPPQPADPRPVTDQHSGADASVLQAVEVVQALAETWWTESLDASHFLTPLNHYLSQHAFLRLLVAPDRLRVDGVDVPDETGAVSRFVSLLQQDTISELLFKDGVERSEVEELIRILRAGGCDSLGYDTLATQLWEADLHKIIYRCSDDLPTNHVRDIEIFDLEKPVDANDDVVAEPEDDAVFSAFSAQQSFPELEIDSLPIHLKRAIFLSPEDSQAAHEMSVSQPEESLQQLVYRLADVYCSEQDDGLRNDARELLLNTIGALLREKHISQVHELLLWLRARVGDGVNAWDELIDTVQGCICAPQCVLLLGNVLNDPEANGKDVLAVRELLLVFDERTIDPLCVLLEKLESMEARKLVCQVLAVVAAEDPEGLARRAEGQPWFVARNLAYVLGRIGGSLVLPFLRSWVLHRDDRVRVEVARALGKVEGSEATEILCGLLNDEEYRVRQSAVWVLSHRGDPAALEHIRRLLFDDRDFRERRAEERDDYFRTYGRLVTDGSYQELVDIVSQRHLLSRGWKFELRRGALIALAETGRSEARALLQKYTSSRNPRLRETANHALRDLRNHGRSQPGARAAMGSMHPPAESGAVAWEEVEE